MRLLSNSRITESILVGVITSLREYADLCAEPVQSDGTRELRTQKRYAKQAECFALP